MTIEEAVEVIGNLPVYGIEAQDDCYTITEYQEAKTMAIKALEQQPRWILCEKQTPTSKAYHFVTMETKEGKKCTDLAEYIPEKQWWDFSKFNDDVSNYIRVIAWMEINIPEPVRMEVGE